MERFEELAKEIKQIADFYGYEHQKLKAAEECAELIQALAKEDSEDHIVEELADVLIMVTQLAYLLGAEKFTKQVERKVDRQLNRILDEMFVDCAWK